MAFSWNPETFREITRYAIKRFGEDRLPQVAGSLTFTSILSLVPILTVAFGLFTAFPMFEHFRSALEDWLFESLIPENISDQILVYLNQFAEKSQRLTTLGLLAVGATSVMTLFTVENAFNAIWRVTRKRNLTQRVMVYWAILTIGPLLMGGSLVGSSWLVAASAHYVNQVPSWLTVMITLFPLALSVVAFTFAYTFIPNREIAWRDAFAGGLVAAIAFELAKSGFAYFITKFPTYTAVYGAFAALPIFLLWIYLSWLVTLFGATFAANVAVMRQGLWQHRDYPGAPFFDALSLLHLLYGARSSSADADSRHAVGVSEGELSRALRIDIPHLYQLLEPLGQLNLVAKLSTENGEVARWAMVCDPQTTTLNCLRTPFLLDMTRFEKTPYGRLVAENPTTLRAWQVRLGMPALRSTSLAQVFELPAPPSTEAPQMLKAIE